MQLDIRSDAEVTDQRPGRLFARGGAVCLATTGRDTGGVTITADHDDGWYDTGDLAVPDGRGGIRLTGRVSDRIGGVFMIPIRDVESELLTNPRVDDVALVSYPDDDGSESPCAVIVPATAPPITLDELRLHLASQGITDAVSAYASGVRRVVAAQSQGEGPHGASPALVDGSSVSARLTSRPKTNALL